ncbi:MAG: ElyC/SanA/YdcF family protein [Dermatophilaceae bacterium]
MTWRRRILIAALSTGVLGAGAAVGSNVWIAGEASGHTYAVADVPEAPVALVLGAGLTPNGRPTPFLADRLDLAKALFDAGKVQVVLVSGDNRTHAYDEPTAMTDYLIAHGVPADKVVRDFAGRDTYDSGARAKRIFGVTRLTVVTQSYHLPRAVATCRALGLDANGVGDDRGATYAASTWTAGAQREKLAAIKAAWDVTSGRDPVLGQQESGVRDALAAP